MDGVDLEGLIACRRIVADVAQAEYRHLVIADMGHRHRLAVRDPGSAAGHVCIVAPDPWVDTRLAALSRFQSARHRGPEKSFRPTAYQRHRFVTMLEILDRVATDDGPSASTRGVAEAVLFPRSRLGRSIEWKTSTERRQTQRLMAEARHLTETGYRDLLKHPPQ